MKIEINKVAEILKKNAVAPHTLRAVVEEMNALTEPDEERPPVVKKQFAILISDPEGVLSKKELAGWVLQLPETESVATVQERIFRAAYDHNTTRKGRQFRVRTVGDALEHIPAKIFREADLWVRTKTPVLALRTDNQIPRK